MITQVVTKSVTLLGLILIVTSAALAQVTLRGQIFGPDGKTLMVEVRFQIVSSDGAFRQYYFSDSNGRIVVPNLRQGGTYSIIIDSDGSTFGSYRQTFNMESVQVLNVYLPRLETKKQAKPAELTVSVPTLSPDVPKDAARSYFQALDLVRRGKLSDSVRPFEQAIARYGRFSEAYNDLGVVYLQLNRLKEAEDTLRRAVELSPENHRPRLNLGIVFVRQKQYSEAIPVLTKCLQLQPGLSDAELRLGEALLESGRMDEAEEHLTAAMQANDANRPEAILKLAIVKVEKNDQAAAIKLLEGYLADYPKASNRTEVESILKQLRP